MKRPSRLDHRQPVQRSPRRQRRGRIEASGKSLAIPTLLPVLLDDSVEAELKPPPVRLGRGGRSRSPRRQRRGRIEASHAAAGNRKPGTVLLDDSVEAELKRGDQPRPDRGPEVLLDDSVEAELKQPLARRVPARRRGSPRRQRRGRIEASCPGSCPASSPRAFSSTTASRPN